MSSCAYLPSCAHVDLTLKIIRKTLKIEVWIDHLPDPRETSGFYKCEACMTSIAKALKTEITSEKGSTESWSEFLAWTQLGWLNAKTGISTFSIGFKQDQESLNILFKMSKIYSKLLGIQRTRQIQLKWEKIIYRH